MFGILAQQKNKITHTHEKANKKNENITWFGRGDICQRAITSHTHSKDQYESITWFDSGDLRPQAATRIFSPTTHYYDTWQKQLGFLTEGQKTFNGLEPYL